MEEKKWKEFTVEDAVEYLEKNDKFKNLTTEERKEIGAIIYSSENFSSAMKDLRIAGYSDYTIGMIVLARLYNKNL